MTPSVPPTSLQQRLLDFANAIRQPTQPANLTAIPAARLQLYRELFFNNICGFINNAFPVLHSLYEADAWRALQHRFFANYACTSPYFLTIAAQFVDFVQHTALTDADPPFLPELAHYEWAELYIGTCPAVKAPAVSAATLAAQPLALSNAAMLSAYQYPVQQISKAFQPHMPGSAHYFLIFRDDEDEVIFVQLNPASFLLLHHLQQQPGQHLDSLINAILPQFPQHSAQQLAAAATPLLAQWASQGAIVLANTP